MSSSVGWISAEADDEEGEDDRQVGAGDDRVRSESAAKDSSWRRLPGHDFPAEIREGLQESALDRNPDLWLYRKRTTALLRRYMRLSIETGRLPSVIGREVFRAKITTYTATSFEDRVIFVHDIERCLEGLSSFDREIVARLVLQEYDHVRAARILHCNRRTIERRLPEILDELSEKFLELQLLVPLPQAKERREEKTE